MEKFMTGRNFLKALEVPEDRMDNLDPFELMGMGIPPFGFSCTKCEETVPVQDMITVENGDVYCSKCFDKSANEEVEILDILKEQLAEPKVEEDGCCGDCEHCNGH
jgi:hypothetical protein